MIASVGIGYSGIEKTELALDVRYIDYSHANGVSGRTGYNADGSAKTPGWHSIFVVSAGIQRRLTESLTGRLGYTWNESPVRLADAFFNTPAPGILQHHLSAGLTVDLTKDVSVSGAFTHDFENTVSGPYIGGGGPIAGTSVTNSFSANVYSMGVTIKH